ncbi:hypothetical protein KGQ20_37105 [Catenulispora sp. NF23]|uniref:hypothetical protein n=1 Tax=Catenulispora pinistramenti TaxID=2705254 RepID=UPI001BA988BF|nr:hypothetical protein [Catenulispora pinistramenti]MBS2538384.1 hypothetical protein [Catenulispora pinistramenti]
MIRRTTLAKTAAVATAGVLAASLSACSNGHSTAAAARPRQAIAQAGMPSTAPVPSGPTGPALRALLPTKADLATGIDVSGAYDSGSAFTAEGDLPAPSLPAADCTAAPAIDADVLTADYRAAYASEELDNTGNSLQLVVAATNPGDAAKQLAEVRAFAARCSTFAAPDSTGLSVGGTIALDSFVGIGDEAIRIRVAAAGPNAANYSQPEVILVRVGDRIAAVSNADQTGNEAAAVSAARLLADRLTGK